jgi:sec-independent protein translocase protein TatC
MNDPEFTPEDESCCDDEKLSVLDHLTELRSRLFYCVIAVFLGFVISFFFSRDLINLLKLPSAGLTQFIQISPGEVFIVSLKVSLYAGIYLALPVIFYQLIGFIAPALRKKEKKFLIPSVIAAFSLFTLGGIFAYFIAMPLALTFLLGYGSDVAENTISISRYVSFNAALLFAMGFLFQIPLLMVFLALINVINSTMMANWWRYIIVSAFIIGAVLTPSPDPFAQSVVAVAVMILYAVSIALVRLIRK